MLLHANHFLFLSEAATTNSKLYAAVVRYQNSLTSAVDGVLLFLPGQELDATGENTAGLTDKSFTRLGILGENCIAFG